MHCTKRTGLKVIKSKTGKSRDIFEMKELYKYDRSLDYCLTEQDEY